MTSQCPAGTDRVIRTQCCVVGGGPAGMMLGLLLARKGVEVLVIEKHNDFFRDFRGDTIHPSTLELLNEMGMLDAFLKLPHQQLSKLAVSVGDKLYDLATFSHLPVRAKFIAIAPQWDFLNFIASQAKNYPNLTIRMGTEALGVKFDDTQVTGILAKDADGNLEINASLVVSADGRHSTIRESCKLSPHGLGVPIDVLWTRIPKDAASHPEAFAYIRGNSMAVLIDRHDYFQCGYVIKKGGFEQLKQLGLDELHRRLLNLAPFLAQSVKAIDSWDKVKLLEVRIDRLASWHLPGVLFIGDAAHAMSPAGGVGVNLAIQDSVAAANILADKLKSDSLTTADLAKVQREREFPVKLVQAIQQKLHRVIFDRDPEDDSTSPPFFLRVVSSIPALQRIVGRILGLGVRMERIK